MATVQYSSQRDQKILRVGEDLIVTVRKIKPSDVVRLRNFFSQLSSETIYFRFLGHKRAYTEAEEKHCCSIEPEMRMAIVAEIEVAGSRQLIGLAEYETIHPKMAEFGIMVADEFQKQGVGAYIFRELMRLAVEEGIEVFTASVHPFNYRMLKFVRKNSIAINRKLDYGAWDIQIALSDM